MIYEWLSGERPFRGSFTEIAVQQSVTAPSSLIAQLPLLPPAVEQVIFTSLAKKPEERFSSICSFVTALEQASTIEPALPPTMPAPPPRKLPKKQAPSYAEETAKRKNQEELPVTQDAPSMQPSALAVSPPSSSLLTFPDGTKVTAKAPSSFPRRLSRRSVVAGLTVLAVAGGGVMWWASTHITLVGTLLYTYPGHSNTVDAVAWSPDGKRIASGSADKTVQVWNAADGSQPYTYTGHYDIVLAVAWSPDGKRIASGSNDNTVQVWAS